MIHRLLLRREASGEIAASRVRGSVLDVSIPGL
jgi:hypothetical protein